MELGYAIKMTDAQRISEWTTRRILVATVESCTGGLIAHRLTEVPGSSASFWGGFVVYDNTAKIGLGVPGDLIARHGAVSPEVARALASSALQRVKEAIGKNLPAEIRVIATTGIAGPTGGTAQKPVGLCYVGLAIWDGKQDLEPQAHEIRAPQTLDRSATKNYFADRALEIVD